MTSNPEEAQKSRTTVLFLCTGNSCRSQMAEGWARQLKDAEVEAHSAGTHPKSLDPRAAAVMAEAGVDISAQRPKSVDELNEISVDWVVTVCGDADENCPTFPSATRVVHVGFDDPPRLTIDARTEEEALVHYRRVRDEIREFVKTLPDSLKK